MEILSQSSLPEEDAAAPGGAQTVEEKEVIKTCILYLRQMADGELGAAEHTFSQMKKHKKAALRVLSSMARSDRPEPELADLPPRMLEGLIRDVSAKMS